MLVQYVEISKDNGLPGSCASCKAQLKCFRKADVLDLKCNNMPTLTGVRLETAHETLLSAAFPKDMSLLRRCLLYSLCPLSIIDEMTMHLFNLYHTVGGTSRLATVEEYYRQPAIYLQACNIIESERVALAAIPKGDG